MPFDLEGTPLQIKTDSAAGSDDEIRVYMHDLQGTFITQFRVHFSTKMEYYVGSCMTYNTYFPTQPPDDVDKIWKFTKTSTAFIMSCNGVEVLNYVFSESSYGDCVQYWSRDVEKIKFHANSDTASDYYRPKGSV